MGVLCCCVCMHACLCVGVCESVCMCARACMCMPLREKHLAQAPSCPAPCYSLCTLLWIAQHWARLPNSYARPWCGAGPGLALAAAVQHLEPRPLWQLQGACALGKPPSWHSCEGMEVSPQRSMRLCSSAWPWEHACQSLPYLEVLLWDWGSLVAWSLSVVWHNVRDDVHAHTQRKNVCAALHLATTDTAELT